MNATTLTLAIERNSTPLEEFLGVVQGALILANVRIPQINWHAENQVANDGKIRASEKYYEYVNKKIKRSCFHSFSHFEKSISMRIQFWFQSHAPPRKKATSGLLLRGGKMIFLRLPKTPWLEVKFLDRSRRRTRRIERLHYVRGSTRLFKVQLRQGCKRVFTDPPSVFYIRDNKTASPQNVESSQSSELRPSGFRATLTYRAHLVVLRLTERSVGPTWRVPGVFTVAVHFFSPSLLPAPPYNNLACTLLKFSVSFRKTLAPYFFNFIKNTNDAAIKIIPWIVV